MPNVNEINRVSVDPVENFKIVSPHHFDANILMVGFLRCRRIFGQKLNAGINGPHHIRLRLGFAR
jgi:hypothetical protein